jgi:hypothetical protein
VLVEGGTSISVIAYRGRVEKVLPAACRFILPYVHHMKEIYPIAATSGIMLLAAGCNEEDEYNARMGIVIVIRIA